MLSDLTREQVHAQKVVDVKTALNGASNCMKMTPFLVAQNVEQLVESLDQFCADIKYAGVVLKQTASLEDFVGVTVNPHQSEAIAVEFLGQPSEVTVRSVFDQARAKVNTTLDTLKKVAQTQGVIEPTIARQAIAEMGELHDVTAAVVTFYQRVPHDARADFYIK